MADMEHHEGSSTSDVSGGNSESTIELNVKTLDSQTYSFHAEKNMAVSAFKEKIASQSGVPVGQQRLIFRGKVLKDELPLSEYHVENGDTLHLVERPSQPSVESRSNSGEATSGQDFSAGQPQNRIGHVSHSVVLGTLNVGEPGEAVAPDIGQVIGAVLNSIGIGNLPGGIQPGILASLGNETEGSRNNASSQNQGASQSVPFQSFQGQSASHATQIPLGPTVAMPTLNMPIPDSLDTLVEFMNRMELALSQIGNQHNQSQASGDHQPTTQLPRSSHGLPTIEAMTIVLRQAQCLLSSHAVPALYRTTDRLVQEGDSSDAAVRGQTQAVSTQLGVAMQHLGALLLELGRTILTLRMGQSLAESSVNAGPAVYISSSGPNPIMVQPFPLQTSSLFGGLSGATPNPMVMTPVGAGSVARNVNIHIHTGAPLTPIIPRMGTGARAGERTHGQSTSGNESGDSSQACVLSGSDVVQPSTSVTQSPDSNPVSSIVAEINSHLRRSLISNLQNENVASGQSQHSTDDITDSGQTLQNGNVTAGMHALKGTMDLPSGGVGETSQTSPHVTLIDDQKAHHADVKETEVNTNMGIPISSEGTNDKSSASERVENLELPARTSQGNNNTDSSSGTPFGLGLGLGLGGLEPKKRGNLPKGKSKYSDGASTSTQNQHFREVGQQVLQSLPNRGAASSSQSPNLTSEILGSVQANSQIDMADAMSQFLENPAMNDILSGVAQQSGVDSPDVFRNMLQQFTQNPAMRNTVNQLAQQIDSQGIGDMISSLGRGGEGGGIDLSRMMQRMMPIVSQALGGVSSAPPQLATMPIVSQALGGDSSASPQLATTPMERMLSLSRSRSNARIRNSRQQSDLRPVVQRIANEGSSSQEIFSSLVDNVAHFIRNDSLRENVINELCSEGGLAQEFMEMLRGDISRRFQDHTGS